MGGGAVEALATRRRHFRLYSGIIRAAARPPPGEGHMDSVSRDAEQVLGKDQQVEIEAKHEDLRPRQASRWEWCQSGELVFNFLGSLEEFSTKVIGEFTTTTSPKCY